MTKGAVSLKSEAAPLSRQLYYAPHKITRMYITERLRTVPYDDTEIIISTYQQSQLLHSQPMILPDPEVAQIMRKDLFCLYPTFPTQRGCGLERASAYALSPFGTFGKVHFNKKYHYKISTMIMILIKSSRLKQTHLIHR